MPFALVFIGLVLVITGARGTMRELGNELRDDFTGDGNFIWWIVSIGAVGALGYVYELRSFSRWFMTLIILSMILANRGFFNKFIEALQSGPENVTERAAKENTDAAGAVDEMLKGIGGEPADAKPETTGSDVATGVGNSLGDLFKRLKLNP